MGLNRIGGGPSFESRLYAISFKSGGKTPDLPPCTLGEEQIFLPGAGIFARTAWRISLCARTGSEGLVGVCLNRSFDSVVSLLAILKAGKTYLPLDPKFPKDRLAFMLADSEVSFLLTDSPPRESSRDVRTSCFA